VTPKIDLEGDIAEFSKALKTRLKKTIQRLIEKKGKQCLQTIRERNNPKLAAQKIERIYDAALGEKPLIPEPDRAQFAPTAIR